MAHENIVFSGPDIVLPLVVSYELWLIVRESTLLNIISIAEYYHTSILHVKIINWISQFYIVNYPGFTCTCISCIWTLTWSSSNRYFVEFYWKLFPHFYVYTLVCIRPLTNTTTLDRGGRSHQINIMYNNGVFNVFWGLQWREK